MDNYDACYLPDGRIIFTSTANLQGVPCVGGSSHVANLAMLDPANGKARMLAFEQDHDWCPTLLPNGRVLYMRWEYTDTPHYFTRLLFHMNPDGTGQMEYYGATRTGPTRCSTAADPRPSDEVRGDCQRPSRRAADGRAGVVRHARGRREADGVVQRIPGRGQPVEPLIDDGLVNDSWPKFLHP